MKRIFCMMLCLVLLASAQDLEAQRRKKKDDTPPPKETPKPKSKNGMKEYKEVITKDAVTDEGLFTVHKVEDKYYFEIQDSLLGREILNVSRIAGIIDGFSFGGAGMSAGSNQRRAST